MIKLRNEDCFTKPLYQVCGPTDPPLVSRMNAISKRFYALLFFILCM